MQVRFEDFSIECQKALEGAANAWLHEAAGELEAQTKENTRVDTGQTKNSWAHVVDEKEHEAVVGNPLENSIYEEFGTGEFALRGDGRKGGWVYKDDDDEWHHTFGKKPNRAFQTAYNVLKNPLIQRAQEIFKERLGK